MISAVFFDVDDTLVDYDSSARAAFRETFGAGASYDLWLAVSEPHFRRYGLGVVGFEEMRIQRTADFLDRAGLAGDPAALEVRRFTLLGRSWRLFDDVAVTLDALRARGIRLGLITNNEPVHQRAKLAQVGLDTGFDAVVISGEVGFAKPAGEIFAHACNLAGVDPVASVHVGDRLDLDARGALAAGMRGVWLDRRGEHDGSALDVTVIRGLDELDPLLN
jgi:putative hydrolase of the HAD superfamily